MQGIAFSFTQLTDDQLLTEVHSLAARERQTTARLIASLAELETRGLHLLDGCQSLFTYCTQRLRLSEAEAYSRITAARAARKWPLVLELPSTVRKLPASRPAPAAKPDLGDPRLGSGVVPASAVAVVTAPATTAPVTRPASHRPAIAPLAPERFKLQFTIGRETHDKLRRVQDLVRHSVADGDPAVVFDRALSLLLADLEKKKCAQTDRPQRPRPHQTGSRHVPAAVRREVWTRDDGRCAFVGASGRCTERGFLEFHHVNPFAEGGETTAANLELRCRAHNAYEARLHFGTLFVREEPATPFKQSWRDHSVLETRKRALHTAGSTRADVDGIDAHSQARHGRRSSNLHPGSGNITDLPQLWI